MTTNAVDNMARSDADLAPDDARSPASGGLMGRITKIPFRYWRLCVAACVGSGVLAAAVALLFSTPVWRAEGKLVHQKLPIPDIDKSVYQPLSLPTLIDQIKSRDNLDKLCAEFNLSIPHVALDKIIKVEPVRDADAVTVILDWPDRDDGPKIVNFLMDLHIQETKKHRQKRIDETYADYENRLKNDQENLTSAQEVLEGFYEKSKVKDLKNTLESLNKDLEGQKTTLAISQRSHDSLQGQIAKLASQLEDLDAKMKEEGPDKQVDAEDLKRKALKKKTEVELRLSEKNFKAKSEEYEKARRLGNAIAPKDLDQIRSDKDTLGAKIDSLKIELESLDKETKSNPTSPLAKLRDQVITDKLRLESSLAGFKKEIPRIEEIIAAKTQQQNRLVDLQTQAAPLVKNVERLESVVKLRAEQISLLNQLKNITSNEFIITTEAKRGQNPYASNAKKLAAVSFAAPLLLFFLALIGYDLKQSAGSAETLADRLRLPVLAHAALAGSRKDKAVAQEQLRSLALRLRQYIPDSGGTILFSSLNDGLEVDSLLRGLSRFFAMRDEKILILDARIATVQVEGLPKIVERLAPLIPAGDGAAAVEVMPEADDGGQPGLVQYLVFQGYDVSTLVFPTTIQSVEYMPSGGPYPMTDVLATQPMKELLEKLRKKYSLVLMAGPPVTKSIDTEILAAYVHGIVVILNGQVEDLGSVETFLQSLREANVPLLGAVACE